MLRIVEPPIRPPELKEAEESLYETIRDVLTVLDTALRDLMQLEAPTITVKFEPAKETKLIVDPNDCTITFKLQEKLYNWAIHGPASAFCTLVSYSGALKMLVAPYLSSLDSLLHFLWSQGINLDRRALATLLFETFIQSQIEREYVGIDRNVVRKLTSTLTWTKLANIIEAFTISTGTWLSEEPIVSWLIMQLLQRVKKLGTLKTVLAVVGYSLEELESVGTRLEAAPLPAGEIEAILLEAKAKIDKEITRLKNILS